MQFAIILFIIGVVLLLVSTHVFIRTAERISRAFKVSPLIIGLTIVSFGTSLPELTVSIIAGLQGDMGLAMGNIIGSNIVNVFLVFGVGILVGKLRVGTVKTQRYIYVLAGITGLFILMYLMKIPGIIAGSAFLFLTFIVTLDEYADGVNGRNHEDARMYKKAGVPKFKASSLGTLAGSLAGVVGGGILTVSSIEKLAVLLGFSTTILGLSLTAMVTSLPELLTTVFSQEDHEDKITIGNVIGSNIYNLVLIGGIVLMSASWKIITTYEIGMLTLSTLVFVTLVVYNKGKIIPKTTGFMLLVLFGMYIYNLR